MSRTTSGARPRLGSSSISSARLAHQRAADGEHLPLAARERAGELGAPLAQAREQHEDLVERLGAVLAAEADLAVGAEQQVVLDRHRANSARVSGTSAMPSMTRSSSERRPIGSPSYSIVPRDGSTPISALSSVDLPAPFGPMTVITLPARGGDRQAVQHLGAAVAGVQVADVEQELGHAHQCSVPR